MFHTLLYPVAKTLYTGLNFLGNRSKFFFKNQNVIVLYYIVEAQKRYFCACRLSLHNPAPSQCTTYVLPPAVNDDLLWHIGWYFRDESEPRPNWCGFMQDVTSGSHLPASDIRLLSMIDMNPSDRVDDYAFHH